jgi:hypothetical protein
VANTRLPLLKLRMHPRKVDLQKIFLFDLIMKLC